MMNEFKTNEYSIINYLLESNDDQDFITSFSFIPKDDIDDILHNKDIIDFLMSANHHYAFVWLVQKLSESELKELLTDGVIDMIMSNEKRDGKLNSLISSHAEITLRYSKIINYCFNNNSKLLSYMNRTSLEFNKYFFDYCINHNKIENLIYLKSDYQKELFKKEENLQLLIENIYSPYDFLFLNINIINKLISHNKIAHLLKNYILKNNLECFINLLNKGLIITNNLILDFEFQDIFLNIKDLNIFMNIENKLLVNNSYFNNLILYKKKVCFDKLIKDGNLNNEDIFNIISVYFFEEQPYNLRLNIQMIKDNPLFDKLAKISSLSSSEALALFKEFQDINYKPNNYYDDYKESFNNNNEVINKEIINLDKMNINEKLSNRYHYDIYYLDGEPFYSLIHSSINGYDKWLDNDMHETISLSLINGSKLHYYNYEMVNMVLGFSFLPTNQVINKYVDDSYSTGVYGTDRVNVIANTKELIDHTKIYNEILVKEDNDKMKLSPSYLMCMNNIEDKMINMAKKLHIPIVLINTKKYKQNYKYNNEYEDLKYLEDDDVLINYESHQK